MEHLISSNTIWSFLVFLAFTLGVTALAKAWLDVARAQKRGARLQRQERVEAIVSDVSESRRAWCRPTHHAPSHGKEYTP